MKKCIWQVLGEEDRISMPLWVLHIPTHQCVHQQGISLNLIVPGFLYGVL